MGRRSSEFTEIIGCADNPFAKMMLPDTVHHHPGGQRIIRTGDPFSQLQTSATVSNRWLVLPGYNLRKVARHGVSQSIVAAADVNLRVMKSIVRSLRSASLL